MAFNNSRNFQRRDFNRPDENRPMFKAVCSECGKDCQVPFKPSGEKPVYCSDCFRQKKGDSEPRRFENRNFSNPRFENHNSSAPLNNDQLNTIVLKLDKIISLLSPVEKPQTVKEVVKEIEIPIVQVEKKKRASKKSVVTPKE
jgi:CxxC-x17-CxxC domain-containing protein